MISVKYTSANTNPSGYGSAARQFITALYISGINLTLETISQMNETADYGISGSLCQTLENRKVPYKIKIIHLTPDLIPMYKEDSIYTIGHLFWECSKLPKEWIEPLNTVDEIWTASEQQAEMIRMSGVDKPKIFSFSQPIDVTRSQEHIEPFNIDLDKSFIFYSCFQWILRKNPRALLRAYWQEFKESEDVALLLKTYRITYNDAEYKIIKDEVRQWKNELKLFTYPKVYIAHDVLSDDEMWKLHTLGDCYINPSSGEGWGRPMQEAIICQKPVISANNGGITDIITPDMYYQIKSTIEPAKQQSFISWYTPELDWKEIDENDLRKKMRYVYENYKETLEVSRKALEFAENNFSYQTVGNLMKKRLEEIYANKL